MMGATPPVTMVTKLLLVLATTTALFFDAARCRVMMFMPGHLEEHDAGVGLKGIATEKSDDSSKLEVLSAAVTSFPTPPNLVHAVFGTKPTYKWYTAVKALQVVAKGLGKTTANDADGNYYVFRGPRGNTITEAEWRSHTVMLDPIGNALPKEIVWIALVQFEALKDCTVLSVYINEEPSFRSGPMRYAGYKGKAVLAAVEARSQQKFTLQVFDIDTSSGNAENVRLFYGYGTFENAKVAMDVHFQVTGKAPVATNAIDSAAGFVYHDFAGSHAALGVKTADVTIEGDAHSLGWVGAYDPTLRKFAFYQKMSDMGDGFHNGVLTMGTHADATTVGLKGTIVLASRDSNKFTLHLPKVANKAGQNAVRAFYGKRPWSTEIETALDAIPTVPADDTAKEICLSTTPDWDVATDLTDGVVNTIPGLFEFDMKPGDTCGMVKWVAFRQTSGGKKYLAHRDMTKM